jgi:hypothetical protein
MDRFELEQAIVACGNVADDLDMLLETILEDNIDPDRIANALLGARELHEMRCKKAFDIFSHMIQTGHIS